MRTLFTAWLMLLLPISSYGASADEATLQIQQRWAEIKYNLDEKQQESAYKALSQEAAKAVSQHPDSAELLIWEGIVLSTYAGAKGGLGALELVEAARDRLQKSLDIDPTAMNGSAYTSLGALYYQVPGWPLSFGSDKKARKLLTRALELNPDGIDSNFFYAEFLISQDQQQEAKRVLTHALEAPDRPNRELADRGRRAEIEALLNKL